METLRGNHFGSCTSLIIIIAVSSISNSSSGISIPNEEVKLISDESGSMISISQKMREALLVMLLNKGGASTHANGMAISHGVRTMIDSKRDAKKMA